MHFSSLRTVAFGLTALVGTTSATVSLASFIPRIDNLPSQCASIYNAKISGCTADDFKPTATCSSACVQGLVKITEAVNRSCADVDVGETSIIGVFQNGLGIQALCPGITVTTVSSSSSKTSATSQTSTKAAASTTSTESTSSRTQEAQPTSSSSSGLILNPSASATATFATSTVNAPPTNTAQPRVSSTGGNTAVSPSQAPKAQLSNADSGGGSPFDVVAVSASPRARVFDMTMATLLATAILFVACV